jgi:hypothetical protein
MKISRTPLQTDNNPVHAQPEKAPEPKAADSYSRTILFVTDSKGNSKPIADNSNLRKSIDNFISKIETCKRGIDTERLIFSIALTPQAFTREDFSRIYYMSAIRNECRVGAISAIRLLAKNRPDIASADMRHFVELFGSPNGKLQLTGEMAWTFLPEDISGLIDEILANNSDSETASLTFAKIIRRRAGLLRYTVWNLKQREKLIDQDKSISAVAKLEKIAQLDKIRVNIDSIVKQIKAAQY